MHEGTDSITQATQMRDPSSDRLRDRLLRSLRGMEQAADRSTSALFAALKDRDPQVRSAAAVEIGERWKTSSDGVPPTPELMAELASADAENPGIADAFWTTVVYDFGPFAPDFGQAELKAWMLGVLHARRDRRRALSPVPGNDLEFYAHETFDGDFDALTALLSWGYVDVVELALDHGALGRDQQIALMTALYTSHGKRQYGAELAIGFGVLREDAMADWPVVKLGDGAAARMFSRDYAYRRLWTAYWLFPHPASSTFSFDRPESVIESLIESGIPIEEDEAELDLSKIDHIAFPDLPETIRSSYRPRRDLALDVATHGASGAVAALRLVRARRPIER
jgi:hypothetical protein